MDILLVSRFCELANAMHMMLKVGFYEENVKNSRENVCVFVHRQFVN
jgi:hypothetical protein